MEEMARERMKELVSGAVWNGGTVLPIPQEKNASLHKT
jgi:hypothetical protein